MFAMNVILTQSQISPIKLWVTQIRAISQVDGELRVFDGPLVPGVTRSDAERYCQEHGLDYVEVLGMLIEREIVFQVGLN